VPVAFLEDAVAIVSIYDVFRHFGSPRWVPPRPPPVRIRRRIFAVVDETALRGIGGIVRHDDAHELVLTVDLKNPVAIGV